MTPPQPRHPLALLAEAWEARARLLTENARTEQSEQSARYYAARAAEAQDCATQLREALHAQAEAETRASHALERDRTRVAEGVVAVKRVLEGYSWLTEGRGPYAHDDDRWRDEFGNAIREIGEALEPLRLIGRDLTDCPTLWADVQAARKGLAALAQAGGDGQ